jgi:hypothetical protein
MVTVTYKDFDLQIRREGDRYVAQVHDSPAGASQQVPLRWPFRGEHWELLLRLEIAVLRTHGVRGALMSKEEKTLQEFGSDVFRAVFRESGEISELFSQSLAAVEPPEFALRLKLRVEPPELALLPWEYVYDASARMDRFLCLEEKLPLVRFLVGKRMPFQPVWPLRVLVMVSNLRLPEWVDVNAQDELDRMQEAFSSVPSDWVKFERLVGGTIDNLFDRMREGPWHIFHFIGHGGTDLVVDDEGNKHVVGYVVMHNGRGGVRKVYARELGKILEDGRVHLAVLNCCDSGRGSGYSNTGAALVKSSVPLAIAMQFPISNNAASRFSGQFYKSLVGGASIEAALTAGRRFVHVDSNLEWGIPVLFTRDSPFAMFGQEAPPPAQQPMVAAPLPGSDPPRAADEKPELTEAQKEFRRMWEEQ